MFESKQQCWLAPGVSPWCRSSWLTSWVSQPLLQLSVLPLQLILGPKKPEQFIPTFSPCLLLHTLRSALHPIACGIFKCWLLCWQLLEGEGTVKDVRAFGGRKSIGGKRICLCGTTSCEIGENILHSREQRTCWAHLSCPKTAAGSSKSALELCFVTKAKFPAVCKPILAFLLLPLAQGSAPVLVMAVTEGPSCFPAISSIHLWCATVLFLELWAVLAPCILALGFSPAPTLVSLHCGPQQWQVLLIPWAEISHLEVFLEKARVSVHSNSEEEKLFPSWSPRLSWAAHTHPSAKGREDSQWHSTFMYSLPVWSPPFELHSVWDYRICKWSFSRREKALRVLQLWIVFC